MQIAAMVIGGCQPINYECGPLILDAKQFANFRFLCFFGGAIDSGEWLIDQKLWQAGDDFLNQFPKPVVWIKQQSYWYRDVNVWRQLLWVGQRMGYRAHEFEEIWDYFLTLWPTLKKNQCVAEFSEREMADLDLLRGLIMRPRVVLFEEGTVTQRLSNLVAADLAPYGVKIIEVKVCDDHIA